MLAPWRGIGLKSGANMISEKVIYTPAASRARGIDSLDVDGNIILVRASTRPRGRVREGLRCSWREACKAADYALEHFGNPKRDRGIWVWYCRRIGLDTFLELVDEVASCVRQGEILWPARAFQRHLQESLPKEGAR